MELPVSVSWSCLDNDISEIRLKQKNIFYELKNKTNKSTIITDLTSKQHDPPQDPRPKLSTKSNLTPIKTPNHGKTIIETPEIDNTPNKTLIANKNSTTNEKNRVYVLGDSIVNGIEGAGLATKGNFVTVKSFSGAPSSDMVDFVRPFVRKKPKEVIVHVGTNDITKNIDTVQNLKKIIKLAHQENVKIAISNICLREDKSYCTTAVVSRNSDIKKLCSDYNVPLIENANIVSNCLARKKLHLNGRGLSMLAQNFKRYLSK